MHEKPNNFQDLNPAPEHKNFRIKLPELTYKTQWRLFAATLEIPIALYLGIVNALQIEHEPEARAALSILAVSLMTFMASDGIVDLIKGTHHFLGLKVSKVLGNKKWKEKVDKAIEGEMYTRDKKRSDFKTNKN